MLVLASMSYFFVIEAWYDYKEERTNMSTGRIPIQGHPTMTICAGPPENRLTIDWVLKGEFYYYKIPPNSDSFTQFEWRKLYEGVNHFKDEEIILKTMIYCSAIISRPKENYQHKPQEHRLLKVVFPDENEIVKAWGVKADGTKWTFGEVFWYYSLFVTFTSEENLFTLDYEMEGIVRLSSNDYEVTMRKQYDFELLAQVEIDPRITTYIEERGNCRTESIPELIALNYTSAFVEDVFLKDNLFHNLVCGNGICVPNQLPVNESISKLPPCDGFETCCEKWMMQSIARSDRGKYRTKPCTHLEYFVDYQLHRLEKLKSINQDIYEHNYESDKTNFAIMYTFKQPESTSIREEYYVVPLMDLIGLAGGTLGIFIGFSFYGTLADVLGIMLSMVLKIKVARSGKCS